MKFLEKSSPPLEFFMLRGTHSSASELIQLLQNMRQISCLHFRPPLFLDVDDIPIDFHQLGMYLGDPGNIPELRRLEIPGLPDGSSAESLISAIRMRVLRAEENILEEVSLRVVKDFRLGGVSESWVRSLRSDGISLIIEKGEDHDYDLW
jgi:hypothetical protein